MANQNTPVDSIYTGIYTYGTKQLPITVKANYISFEAIQKLAAVIKDIYS